MRSSLIISFAALALAACGGSDGDPEAPMADDAGAAANSSVALHLESDGGAPTGPIEVTAVLTNVGDEPITVVEPFVMPNLVSFRVTGPDGERVPFVGPHPELPPLEDGRFLVLEPDESTSWTFDLAAGYVLDSGTHTISAEYLNPSNAPHAGGRALVFEPGDGPEAPPIIIEVAP